MEVRYGWIAAAIGFVIIIGLISCDSTDPFRPIEPVDKFLYGSVTNDEGDPIKNVTVTIYEEGRTPGGANYVASVVSDDNGRWEKVLTTSASQTYTIYFSKSGMFDAIMTQFVSFGFPDTINTGIIAIPSSDIEDKYRIVLTWGNEPPDLDAHLTGPKEDGGRFHIYWGNRIVHSTDGKVMARLVSDRRTGFGPETIAINELIPGTYRFSVHNYSRNEAQNDRTLFLRSNALVRIFSPNGLEREFAIQDEDAPADSVGNTWRVFEIDGATGNIQFINEMLDGIGFDEEGVFRMSEKPELITIP